MYSIEDRRGRKTSRRKKLRTLEKSIARL